MKTLKVTLSVLIAALTMSACSTSDTNNPVLSNITDRTLAISIPLSKEASANVSTAQIIVFSADMDTITAPLVISSSTISGSVTNIPLGYSRKIEISVYDKNGIIAYFGETSVDVLSNKPISVTIQLKPVKGTIIINGTIVEAYNEFTLDDKTLALYRLNESMTATALLDETARSVGSIGGGIRTDGYSKGALSFSNGKYASFISDTIIPTGTANGTVECYFKWSSTWDSTSSYAIFGNNGARCLLVYKNKQFYFLKNHDNIFKHVSGTASTVSNKWYHLAATWGSNGMRIFLDGKLIGSNTDKSAYQRSSRGISENSFYIGMKTYDGMEGVGIYSTTGFEGTIDEIRISKTERY
ncbi:MAG: LamG domain-containing protein [Fibrobacteres bacterium]|nr:LamG domain-containing protein [Fibrobacterota bacterium]